MKTLLQSILQKLWIILGHWVLWWWRYGVALLIFAICFVSFIPSSTIQHQSVWEEIPAATSLYNFDFITWEINAIGAKVDAALFGQSAYASEADRSQFVRDYMADLAQVLSLESEIASIYNNPQFTAPADATQSLRSERDALRATLNTRQSTVEAILEGQVAAVLVDEGFGTLGQLLPPMAMRFTRMPNLLVTSPRDTIRMENSLVIDALTIDERSNLEDEIMETFDVSALIVPLGGIALYPAMIQETSNLSFVIETFAHEWLHHYLYFHPLGISYFTGDGFAGEARIINETTSDLFGKEIAAIIIQRYYPELMPPRLPTIAETTATPTLLVDPDAFNFADEMAITRTQVDALLADGDVDAAEAYMNDRRLFFYDNGYALRRINQAFFAFYGGYQAGGGIAGAGGTDPIGSAVIATRQGSSSIYEFIQTMQSITTRQQLLNIQN
ncbi:MAG: hypothetical protein WBC91_07100 [Phototrophicaceae bacterium]